MPRSQTPKMAPAPSAPSARMGAAVVRLAPARRSALRLAVEGAALLLVALTAAGTAGVPWAALPVIALVTPWLLHRHRSRLVAIDRARAREAQLALYKIAETMARTEREEDLVRHALDAIAEGMGIPHWAMYFHKDARGAFVLVATRGLSAEAERELAPDPPGPEAIGPASRAASWREMQTLRAGEGPRWSFPERTPGLGPEPVIVSVPFSDLDRRPAVLQCFLPRGSDLSPEQGALLRWMSSQLSSGLKRLRLERRDQLLASYLMSTGEILLGLDLHGAITHANAAAERAIQTPSDALLGTRLEQIAVPDGSEIEGAVARSLFDLALARGEYAGAAWFLRPDGGRFPAEVRISPVLDARGAAAAMVLVGRDVTERREHEEELRRRGDELAILNERLERANRDLQDAQRQQNEFLANTSHELRTPLNAVIGFATLLEQGIEADEAERRDFAGSIREAAQHLLGVINDLLDLAKVAAGRFQLQLVVGDLRDVIRAALEAITPLAAAKGLQVDSELPGEPLLAAQDAARVRQVLLNLLGNAVKFTDTGVVRVRAWREPDTEEARIVVEDTGIGIPPALVSRLFRKFAQADSSYHRRHTGTGLGLAISRALVENMGGTIAVESEGLNRGTRVTLTFPAPIVTPASTP